MVHKNSLGALLNFLSTDAVLRTYSLQKNSTLITDASHLGIGAVLEQDGHSVLWISGRLCKAEQGYSQTVLEALAIYWAVNI